MKIKSKSSENNIYLSRQEILIVTILIMSTVSVTQVFLLSALLHLTTSLPVRDEDEVESFLTEIRHLNTPWSLSGMNSADMLLELRQLLSAGLDRRRQLGDIEFSNRYAEFLRSKAKHSSICSFLRRMQGIKKSGVGADVERVNLLLKQYMCPSVYNNWPTDL
ncbi:putative cadherin-related family member 5-like [Scophthalmus maximus]|uniref:Putative cadherin-related family member 5-like n=1 Tax=Scophthalmus maximus TaxID=52904 RepID=A0A2U9BXJ5_SCOMX|nr:putative cadherin-related family member 5-like [Scophthalmus maximus]